MNKVSKVIRKLPSNYWWATMMEFFERGAWYGMFIPLGIYLTGSTDTGALGFSQVEKGTLLGTVLSIIYFLPLVTGAISDKFGYRKTLIIAHIILASGYFIMGQVSSYPHVFIAFFWVAIGASLFKPVVIATIGMTTDKETSSIGFGIVYMIANIGAFIGPVIASILRGWSWSYVFTMSAIAIIINLMIVVVFFKEPVRKNNQEALGKAIKKGFKDIIVALSDIKFLLFLIIMMGFWTVYNQLFYTLPVFIDQWVHTTAIYDSINKVWPWLATALDTQGIGAVASEMVVSLDALFIVIFQIAISAFAMRYKPLNAMIVGVFLCSLGMSLTLLTQNGIFIILSIFIFTLGEMSSLPKISEYITRIAPRDKVALYMGCSFLSSAGGNFFAGQISGIVYQKMSDKVTILEEAVADKGFNIPHITDGGLSQNDYFSRAAEQFGMNQAELTDFLWQTYHPMKIWYIVLGIGLGTTLLLWLYDKFLQKR